jgi:hypothetical protein
LESDVSSSRPSVDPARIGRRFATLLYWALALYIVAVGVFSIVPQVFWPHTRALAESVTCVDGLTDLRGELLANAGQRVEQGGARPEALRTWLIDWDARHAALEARCGGQGHDAWVLLGRLRQRLESTLVRFDEEEGSLARDVDSALRGLSTTRRGG